MKKYYKKPAYIFFLLDFKGEGKTLKLQAVPTIKLSIKFQQPNEREWRRINIIQEVVSSSPLNKSKYKNLSDMQKILSVIHYLLEPTTGSVL